MKKIACEVQATLIAGAGLWGPAGQFSSMHGGAYGEAAGHCVLYHPTSAAMALGSLMLAMYIKRFLATCLRSTCLLLAVLSRWSQYHMLLLGLIGRGSERQGCR